jgi:F-type H+-transporting ATPase subunit delta
VNLSRSKIHLLAERYSSALYDLAFEDKILPQVVENIHDLEAISHIHEFQYLMTSPHINHDQKEKVIHKVVDILKLNDLTTRFLKIIARNKRLFMLSSLCHVFLQYAQSQEGGLMVELTTPHTLHEKESQSIKEILEKELSHSIVLTLKTDPLILKGSILKIGSLMIDSSAKTKLNRLKRVMNGVL